MGAVPGLLGIALALFAASLAAQPAEPAGENESLSLRDVRWGLAPVRWRGLLATELRSFDAEGQPRQIHRVDSAQVQASSYVWQPWFAQVNGSLGIVSSSDRGTGASRSTGLTGNGAVHLFPASRHPFQASFDVSDSRSADQATSRAVRSTRFGARQSHRSVSGNEHSAAGYSRSVLESSGFGRDTLDVLNASHSRRAGLHALDGNADFSRNRRGGADERAEFARVFGRHAWSSGGLVSLDTTASYGASDLRLASAGTPEGTRNEFFQVNHFFNWRQEEDDPLYVTGGARYFRNTVEAGDSAADAASTMGHANAGYRYSPNLFLSAGASATHSTSSGGSGVLSSTQSAAASYSADPRRFGAYVYSASAGASALNQTGGNVPARQLFSANAGHNVQRTIELGGADSLVGTLSQNLAEARDSVAGGLHTLGHHASLMWRAVRGEELAGLLGVSAADSRTRGHTRSAFQLLNAQASAQAQTGRYAFLTGNLTVQGTRQASAEAPLGPFNVNIGGGLTYQHQRAFGVPGLRYLATYERNDYRTNTRLEGDLEASREHVTASLDQRLEWRIGKLVARLSFRLAEIDGKESASLFLRLARELGD